MISRAEAEQWAEDYLPGGKWVKPGEEYLVNNPLREDRNPSLAVSFAKKCYIDRGAGESGKLSDLCARLNIPEPGREERKNTAAVPDFNAIIRNGEAKKTADKSAEARLLWDRAVPAGADHPYIERKGINADGLRQTADGVLLVPAFSFQTGELAGVERIDMSEQPGRQKRHLGQKAGTFFLAGDMGADTPIVVAEGAATACSLHAITGWPCVSSFGAGELVKVARVLETKYPGRDIILAPDFDQAGRNAAVEARRAGFKVVELPQGSKDKADWNDLLCERGVEAARELFQDRWQAASAAETMDAAEGREGKEPADDERRATRFKLQRIGDIKLVEPEYLVNGLVEADTLAMFFGETESFKSFCAIDLAACIATGAPWAGRQVKEGAVVYVAGEGRGGLARRARAWELQRGISLADAPLFVSSKPGLFLDERSALEVEAEVDRVADECGAPLLIAIDTVARAMSGGDENSAKDTGLFVERVDALRRRYGATVLLVHHSGLVDKGRGRGSSALKAALDAEYQVERADNTAIITATKTKDGPRPAPLYFEAVEHVVLVASGGDEITSLAMARTDEKPAARETGLSGNNRLGLDSLMRAAREHGVRVTEGRGAGVHVDEWRDCFYRSTTADDEETKRRYFNRARAELVKREILEVDDNVYFPLRPADRLLLNSARTERMSAADDDSAPGQNGTKRDNVPDCPARNPTIPGQTGTHSYRSVPLSRLDCPGQEEKELSDNAVKGEKAPGTLPEERAVEIPSPRGQKILGAKDVRLPDALRWARNQPGLMKRLALEARQMGDGGMVDAGDYLNTAVKCEYAAFLNGEAGASQGDSPEAAPSEGAASTGQGAKVVSSLADREPAAVSLEAIAARAGVDVEVVREGVLPWVQVGRLAVSGDSVRIVEGATGYPGDDEPDAPDDEPPDDSSDIREGEEPDSKGGEVMPDDKVPVPDYGDGGPAPGQSEASYRLLGRWSEEEQEADIARLATMSRERGDEEGR